ncbi:HEAT repeat domain-containing protein [Streptomyces sp. NPDC056713]
MQTLRTDASAQIRISAAETLIRHGHRVTEAVDFLSRTLAEHADVRVRLQAINALTFIDVGLARPARPAIEAAATSKDEYLHNAGRYLRFMLDGTYTPSSPVYEPVTPA